LLFPVAGMTSNGWESFTPWRQFWDIMWHMIVPGFVVATGSIAGFTRVLRGQMIEYLSSDFIRTARAKGSAPARSPTSTRSGPRSSRSSPASARCCPR
jgi:peptide/nickel transport system permease protein